MNWVIFENICRFNHLLMKILGESEGIDYFFNFYWQTFRTNLWWSWFETAHDKTNKMTCAPSEDSDQHGHLPSLIRVFAVRMKKHWVLSYPKSAQWRLIRCPVWSESSLGPQVILLVLSCGGSFVAKHITVCQSVVSGYIIGTSHLGNRIAQLVKRLAHE